MSGVATQHPEYRAAIARWELVRAILGNNAQQYIRKPDINDRVRNDQYRKDGILTNFTKLTQSGLAGLIFRKPLCVTLPPELEYLLEDVTGTGINLSQFSQHGVSELIAIGRFGLFIDYSVDAGKAYIKPYAAEAIINWKERLVNGVMIPWLIVLEENIVKEDPDDIYCQDLVKQSRVLRLDDNDEFLVEVFNEDDVLIETTRPQDYNKKPFNFIPFIAVGSENNDLEVDYQPLYDMAIINLGHYRNSCDYEESIFVCGQPFPVVCIGDSTSDDFNAANPNGVLFGSRKGLVLPLGGNASLLQASPNQLVAQAMSDKLKDAAAVGARLISPAGGRETAEAARIRFGGQNSALYTLTSNFGWGVEDALDIICQYMGCDDSLVEYELNNEFYDETADPNLVAQQIMLLDRAIIAPEDIRDYGRRTGFISPDRTDEEIDADNEQINPLIGAAVNAGSDIASPNPANAPSADTGKADA